MAQYLKPESELGYVEDLAEIENLKFNNLRHVVLGCMLGDFDEVGNYIIPDEIVDELISMEKYLVNTYDNIELCKSTLKLDKQISFMVTYEGNRATLSLVEKLNYEANFALNSGTYSNINEYVLDVVETSGEVNRNVLYDRWNIKLEQGQIVDIFSCDDSVLEKFFGIVNRFKYLLATNKILLEKEEEIEELEAIYANEMMDIFKHYPNFNAEVMNSVKEVLSERKNLISAKKLYFAKTFNEVLESVIASNLSQLNENQRAEFEKEKRNALNNLSINRHDILDVEKVQSDESEKSHRILKVRTNSNYESRSLEEVATEFVSTHKTASSQAENNDVVMPYLIQRAILALGEKNGQQIKLPTSGRISKNKLISTLNDLGLYEEIGLVKEKPVETVADKPAKQSAPTNTKSSDKRPQAKSDDKGKSSSKNKKGGSTGKKTQKPKVKTKDGESSNKTQEPRKITKTYTGSVSAESDNKKEQEKEPTPRQPADNKQPQQRAGARGKEVTLLSTAEMNAYLAGAKTNAEVLNNANTSQRVNQPLQGRQNLSAENEVSILQN